MDIKPTDNLVYSENGVILSLRFRISEKLCNKAVVSNFYFLKLNVLHSLLLALGNDYFERVMMYAQGLFLN